MSIATELESLSLMKERGNLTPAEFAQAKRRLLAENAAGADTVQRATLPLLQGKAEHERTDSKHLIAILSTVAMAFSAVSAVISPSPLKGLAFALLATACLGNWVSYYIGRGRRTAA